MKVRDIMKMPEQDGWNGKDHPQYAVFRMGGTEITLKDFVPSNFSEGTFWMSILALYASHRHLPSLTWALASW